MRDRFPERRLPVARHDDAAHRPTHRLLRLLPHLRPPLACPRIALPAGLLSNGPPGSVVRAGAPEAGLAGEVALEAVVAGDGGGLGVLWGDTERADAEVRVEDVPVDVRLAREVARAAALGAAAVTVEENWARAAGAGRASSGFA